MPFIPFKNAKKDFGRVRPSEIANAMTPPELIKAARTAFKNNGLRKDGEPGVFDYLIALEIQKKSGKYKEEHFIM
jgi:hypothetical protein